MEGVSDWCWGKATEMCPEGGVRGDEYLSSFHLRSLTIWRHNIQNEITDSDSFGANLVFCLSQGKALLGYRGSSVSGSLEAQSSHGEQLLWTCLWFKTWKLNKQPIALSCSTAQTLLPLGSAAFSCPHLPYSCNDVVDKRIEQLWKKDTGQPQTKLKIHHLGHWKRDLGGKFFIPQVSDPVWDPHTNFQGQKLYLLQKARDSQLRNCKEKGPWYNH